MSLFDQTRRLSILRVGVNQKFKPQPVFEGPPVDRFDGIDVRGAVTATLFIAPGEGPPVPPEPTEGGSLWAWGSNGNGQTGLGTSIGSTLIPTQVGADNWQSVSAGLIHSLAIRADGTLWAWGSNGNGRTGLGTSIGRTLIPTQVETDNNWQSVSAGAIHSLAIRADGSLWAWGFNGIGQTGLGTTIGNTLIPTQIIGSNNWQSVSAGGSHSLGIRADGTLWAWGSNGNGRTGLGTDSGSTLIPTQVETDNNWQSVSAGDIHSLAIQLEESNGSAGPRTYKLWAYVDKIGWGLLEQGEVPERGFFRSINCAPFDKLYIETETADAVQIGVGTL